MSSGWRVVCSDGNTRHESLFRSRRDALTWQTVRHVCPFDHTVRREAEWRISEIRIVAGADADSVTPLPGPAPATPSSVIETVFGKEPAHA
jgi:hypothetical protein